MMTEQISLDKRPDLKEDHALWERILKMALDYYRNDKSDFSIFRVLEFFRNCGTRIKLNVDGHYVLRPDVDPKGHSAWESEGEYKEHAGKYLKPIKLKVEFLLNTLKVGE